MSPSRTLLTLLGIAGAGAAPLAAQQRAAAAPPAATPARSAPISNVTYEVAFDSASGATRLLRVAMSFDAARGAGPVLLSLPVWTPGAYEISDFSKRVLNFTAEAAGRAVSWDKIDPDT
ncbi:MAG TPA: hypothetical protein VHJ69_12610, partial [Gemmatimonadales bacterium]|nr:hypothetical protein [Gemmatimonadales bacterium]